MPAFDLATHEGLRSTTRLRLLTTDDAFPQMWEWVCLVTAGVAAAAASTFLGFNLRVPGHAILRVVFPIAVGFALVPRRGGGTIMGSSAILAAMGFRFAGFGGEGLSLGALTSLTATGPLLDWTLRRARGGGRLYLAFALAGLVSNLLALLVRAGAKAAGWEHVGARPLSVWLPQAALTYVICGALAGLLSAAIWFYARPPGEKRSPENGT